MPTAPNLFLVAGLGNPDPEYERTRHNLGFVVADRLAARLGARFKRSKHSALVAEARDADVRIVLAKPVTFMNESGRAVGALARFYKVPAGRIVVVHDELDLPLGTVRVKLGGGTAGHKGLDSIVEALGARGFARVRIGIGKPAAARAGAGHVLSRFRKKEQEEAAIAVETAADAVLAILHEGVASAQTRFNAVSAP